MWQALAVPEGQCRHDGKLGTLAPQRNGKKYKWLWLLFCFQLCMVTTPNQYSFHTLNTTIPICSLEKQLCTGLVLQTQKKFWVLYFSPFVQLHNSSSFCSKRQKDDRTPKKTLILNYSECVRGNEARWWVWTVMLQTISCSCYVLLLLQFRFRDMFTEFRVLEATPLIKHVMFLPAECNECDFP